MVRQEILEEAVEGWGRGVNLKLRFGNTKLRHPNRDILKVAGDMEVEFGEVRAKVRNVGVILCRR